jgi:hypothetical protein
VVKLRVLMAAAVSLAASTCGLRAQVIQFESGGLRYQTVSHSGFTVMMAPLPDLLREYAVLQVGVSNGSPTARVIRPEDFQFRRADGSILSAMPARAVVDQLRERASRNDVIKLISTYEMSLYSGARFRSTNGYEQRRQAALAELGSNRLRAAAAASAIAFVETKLPPGGSTDGAVFFYTARKPLGPGRVVVQTAGMIFEFDPEAPVKSLQRRN